MDRTERRLRVEVLEAYPHATDSFTQGLLFSTDGALYESTGLNGNSRLRRVDPTTGAADAELHLSDQFFCEGIAEVGDHIIWLTYRAGVAHVVDRARLEIVDRFTFEGEGWGLANAGDTLLMSTGDPARLQIRELDTFALIGDLAVTRSEWAGPINDLVVVDGTIWANSLQLFVDEFLGVDAATGTVTAAVDARALLPAADQRALQDPINDVLNGITYQADSGHFYVTGKCWPWLFEVRFSDAGPGSPRLHHGAQSGDPT